MNLKAAVLGISMLPVLTGCGNTRSTNPGRLQNLPVPPKYHFVTVDSAKVVSRTISHPEGVDVYWHMASMNDPNTITRQGVRKTQGDSVDDHYRVQVMSARDNCDGTTIPLQDAKITFYHPAGNTFVTEIKGGINCDYDFSPSPLGPE